MQLLFIAICLLGAAPSQQQDSAIRVAIVTQESRDGFTDPDLKRRKDSLEDLKKALQKSNGISIVDDAVKADVSLEVLSSALSETGNLLTSGGSTRKEHRETVSVRLRSGSYQNDFSGMSGEGQIVGAWSTAAKEAAKQIEKWVSTNRAAILAKRKLAF